MNVTSAQRFLVTGAHGCIGAWVVRQLVSEGAEVVALDVSDDVHRLRLLLDEDELERVGTARADITRFAEVEATLDRHEITNIIHLAALQVPFCRDNPPLGAEVNVVGTVNLFEAAARRIERIAPVVYASSIAAYEDGQTPSLDGTPGTLYGVYKRANEGAATLYLRDRGLASVGLRPHTVYGPGRDQGLTSSPTAAMLAAALGRPFEIAYGGRFALQYAPDVAAAFVAASRGPGGSAAVHNIAGAAVDMSDVVDAIEAAAPESAGTITYAEQTLPFPAEADSTSLTAALGDVVQTPLRAGVVDTIERFRRLAERGLVD